MKQLLHFGKMFVFNLALFMVFGLIIFNDFEWSLKYLGGKVFIALLLAVIFSGIKSVRQNS